MCNNIYDINIKEHVGRFIGKTNTIYVMLDVVIVVLLLTFIEPFAWTYMAVKYIDHK